LEEQVDYGIMFLSAHKRGQLLDVGCGNGEFLAFMRGLGWEVAGIEPDPEAAAIAKRQFGVPVLASLDEVSMNHGRYDAITMRHVIEHLPNPIRDLRVCLDLLKPGGMLAVVTPNIKSLAHRRFKASWGALDPPRHLVLFSPEALRHTFESTGFRVIRSGTSARAAGGVLAWSRQIQYYGRAELTGSPWWSKVDWRVFVALEHLVKLFGDADAGEEIGVLGVKEPAR
jgi:SAM-dependent methyltransferase